MTSNCSASAPSTADGTTDDNDPRWTHWGPYMSNREWGTVRETDGPEGANWTKFPFEQAASTAYRFAEDGIFGVCDKDCRVCHSYALWNHQDCQLKERYFGLSNGQGARGEDVKEVYYYKSADPRYKYICAEYLYPQIAYPYDHLVQLEGAMKSRDSVGSVDSGGSPSTVSLADYNGWYEEKKYFKVEFEMSKLGTDQLYFQLSITNCGVETAKMVAMPMLFLRNTWSTGRDTDKGELGVEKVIKAGEDHLIVCLKDADGTQTNLGYYYDKEAVTPEILLTDNNSRLQGSNRQSGHFKDAFNRYIVNGDGSHLMPNIGAKATKAGICYRLKLLPKQQVKLRSFLVLQKSASFLELNWRGLSRSMETVRLKNLVDGYQSLPTYLVPAEQDILNAAYTNLLWNRQYYPLDQMSHLWHIPGDLPTRLVTVPDKWEQPYLATWDAALHCLCLSCFDRSQALKELLLLLALIRPDGSLYNDEYRPDGVTPPLLVLAAIDVYGKCTKKEQLALGSRIYAALKSHLHWWLHRKDVRGVALVDGGVCGVDYVSLFPRELLETGEGLIWAVFFIMRFLELSLAIYSTPGCDPILSTAIVQDLRTFIGYMGRLCAAFVRNMIQDNGLYHPYWLDVAAVTAARKDATGDEIASNKNSAQVNIKHCGCHHRRHSIQSFDSASSIDGSCISFSGVVSGGGSGSSLGVGLEGVAGCDKQPCRWLHAYCYLPLICCCSLPNVRLKRPDGQKSAASTGDSQTLEELFATSFNGSSDWETRAPYIYTDSDHSRLFVTLLNSHQMAELLEQIVSEVQFLSQYGIRTMSILHSCDDATARLAPNPHAEAGTEGQLLVQRFCSGATSGSSSYGGNTNWYGAVNLPYNYLMLEAMNKWSTVLNRRFDIIEFPSYTGQFKRMKDIVQDLAARNVALFMPSANGTIPSTGTGEDGRRGLLMFETFNGDTGKGYGASHKGGWSAIIVRIIMLMHSIDSR